MNLLDSLLDAIIRLDGDALVMHVGEKPYVVTTSEASNEYRGPLAWGQVELSSRVLTSDAVAGMLGQILPLDQRAALDEYGATDYEVAAAGNSAERFTIVAARGGDDIWLEIRRQAKQTVDVPMSPAEMQIVDAAAREHGHVLVAVEGEEGEAGVDDIEDVEDDEEQGAVEAHAEADEAAPRAEHEPELEPVHEDEAELVGVAQEPAYRAASADVSSSSGSGAASFDRAPLELPSEDDEIPLSFDSELSVPLYLESEPDIDEPLDLDVEELTSSLIGGSLDPSEPLELDALQRAQYALGEGQAWGDDVMTEGELGELLRASASALILGHADPLQASEPEVVAPEVVEPVVPAPVAVEHQPVVAVSVPQDIELEQPRPAVQAPAAAADVDSFNAGAVAAAEQESSTVSFDEVVPPATAAPSDAFAVAEAAAPVNEPVPAVAAFASGEAESLQGETDETAETAVQTFKPAAVVVPLSRQPRQDTTEGKGGVAATVQRLLRLAAARGAASVYVVAQSAPMVRIDGEFSALDGEPTLSGAFVERLLAELTPRSREGAAPAAEWITEVPEIGRVRCVTFRDHRGPGVIFRMVPPRAISAEQLGLSAEVQALCTEADGLVLVAGGRGTGRSTLLASFVDLINRSRSDYIITAEPQIEFVHENKRSFISQREVRGSSEAVAAAVRAASREEPDVLVIEDLRTPELVGLAIDAAESGRLVFAAVPAASSVSAVERVLEMFPPDRREKAQAALAGVLRGVVSQVLLRKLKGGRVAAREVLINTPAVASLISEGKTFELQSALETGRKFGMISFSDSLTALVRDGSVHPSHAFRKAPDREHFLSALSREGFDASIAERLA